MSADRQRLKSAIRRIALTPEERRQLLGEGQNKGGKASSAGVGTSEAEESRLCCDGSTSNSANPGTSERDPDASSQDGLDSTDPAKLGSGDGTLSGVTDCATGEPVCFDGAGFVPPEGWDDPQDPPVDPTCEIGSFWRFRIYGGASLACTADLTQSGCIALAEGGCFNNTAYIEGEDGECLQNGCGEGDPDDLCGEDVECPTIEEWPEDGCTNLVVKDGKIVGSKYDPENDGSYSAPRDSIDLCSGGDQISLAPSADGGWKTINSTTNNGYLYDSSGEQIAHIDGNEYSDPNV